MLDCPPEMAEALEKIAGETALKVVDIIRICICDKLEDLTSSEKLSTESRLKIINALIEEMKREERRSYQTWKQMLRNHPKAYLLKNLDPELIVKDRKRLERIKELVKKCPELAKRISELQKKKEQLLKQLLGEEYLPIQELIQTQETETH